LHERQPSQFQNQSQSPSRPMDYPRNSNENAGCSNNFLNQRS
jgi:hypothetical protein